MGNLAAWLASTFKLLVRRLGRGVIHANQWGPGLEDEPTGSAGGEHAQPAMTEAEWLACNDPQKLLEVLGERASERKLRLFACACCRQVGVLRCSSTVLRGMAVAERYADGLAEREEARDARSEVERLTAFGPLHWFGSNLLAGVLSGPSLYGLLRNIDRIRADQEMWALGPSLSPGSLGRAYEQEPAAQCLLLRDIFDNPFRSVALNPAWRTPTVTALATAAYEERSGVPHEKWTRS